jgi:hypothetical protein
MEVKSELVIRLFLAIFLVFVIGKILSTFIRGFFTNFWNPSGKDKLDFDKMIKKQVRILKEAQDSEGENGSSYQNSLVKEEKKYGSLTEKKYQNRFESLISENEKEEKDEVKKAFVFFDNAQWGEGIFFNKVKKKVGKKFSTNIDNRDISYMAHLFLRGDIFLKIKKEKLPSIDEIGNLIEHGLVLKKLVEEAKMRRGSILNHISHREGIDVLHLALGVEYFILSAEKKGKVSEGLIPMLLGDNYIKKTSLETFHEKKISSIILESLVDEKKNIFNPLTSSFHKIFDNAHIFSCLSRINYSKDKLDLNSALKIFNLRRSSSIEEVKKVYKKLAKLKHPDRLSGLNIPEKYNSIANENFSRIQESYKLIIEFKKIDKL